MNHLRQWVHAATDRLDWLPGLLSRVTIAGIFIQAGWGKLHNLSTVTEFFASLGIPFPGIQAPFVACVEFVGGILVMIGLFTRLAAIPLIGTMVVAIATAKLGDVHDYSDFLNMSEYLFIVILLWLVVKGPGALSLDHFWCRKKGMEE